MIVAMHQVRAHWGVAAVVVAVVVACSGDGERGVTGERDGADGGVKGTGGELAGGARGTRASGGNGGARGNDAAAGSGGLESGAGRTGSIDASLDAENGGARSVEASAGTGGAAADGCANCWILDLFPATRPSTISLTGTIQKSDTVCVIVFAGGQCLAQNDPPCNPSSGRTTVTLDLTVDQSGKLTVEAPYQDMCAQDYFCAISGPGCPIPTSYGVPTDTTYSYTPRGTDRCRAHTDGTPYPVEHVVDVRISGTSLIIDQTCTTHMLNQSSSVVDVRNWTTTIDLSVP